MPDMSLTEVIRGLVTENFLFGGDEAIADGDSLIERGIIDSTGVLELVMLLERSFGIEVQDDEVVPENLDSIRSVAAYVRRKAPQAVEA
jgi:acyl carrier protein